MDKGIEEFRYSPTYSPRNSPDQSPKCEIIGLGERYDSEVKRQEGEVCGEHVGEYPGEYLAMANRAQSPCRRAFCDSWVSMVSIFLNSFFWECTIFEKYSMTFGKYSWSISQNSCPFGEKTMLHKKKVLSRG